MQTISGLGTCSLWCHHFARSWTQCIMEYHRWPYYWIYIVQGQYFRQTNINFASLYRHKIWRTNKEFSVPWFHTFAWPLSGPNSEVEEFPTCYVIILKNISQLLLKQCMHACLLGFQRASGHLSHTLRFLSGLNCTQSALFDTDTRRWIDRLI